MRKQKSIVLSTICPEMYDIQLALYYLKAYFIKHANDGALNANIDIRVFVPEDKINKIVRDILKKKPDVLGFSCYIWNITSILKVAKAVKRANRNIILLLGGPEVSPRAEEILKKEEYIDVVVRGEGEDTFRELMTALIYGARDLANIRGLSYRIGDKVVRNQDRPRIPDLTSIPSPYIEGLIDLKMFPRNLCDVPIETMRGCPYRCHYCYYHKDFGQLRYFTLDRIEQDLKYILAKKPRRVWLMDPTFNVLPERAKKILRLFIKYNKESKLRVELRAELLDAETAGLLSRARTEYIEIGVQTTNPKSLKLINRTLNRRAFKRNIGLLNKYGIPYELQIIDGLPGDTYDDLKKSLNWILQFCPPYIKIMRLSLLPGTYLRQHARRFGITYDSNPPYFSFKSSTISRADLERVGQLRWAEVYLMHIGWINETIRFLKRKLSIDFSAIFEGWIKFRNKSGLSINYFNGLRKSNSLIFYLKKIKFFQFLKYICKKEGKPGEYEKILRRSITSLLPSIQAYITAKRAKS